MNRLETIASLIRPCKVFADIGCDHGYISLFVARSALAEKIIATDISALSLDKARRVMADYPAEFFVGDGFDFKLMVFAKAFAVFIDGALPVFFFDFA